MQTMRPWHIVAYHHTNFVLTSTYHRAKAIIQQLGRKHFSKNYTIDLRVSDEPAAKKHTRRLAHDPGAEKSSAAERSKNNLFLEAWQGLEARTIPVGRKCQ